MISWCWAGSSGLGGASKAGSIPTRFARARIPWMVPNAASRGVCARTLPPQWASRLDSGLKAAGELDASAGRPWARSVVDRGARP